MAFVNQGDTVRAGQKLVEFDQKKIQEAGYSTQTMFVVSNTPDCKEIKPLKTVQLSRRRYVRDRDVKEKGYVL